MSEPNHAGKEGKSRKQQEWIGGPEVCIRGVVGILRRSFDEKTPSKDRLKMATTQPWLKDPVVSVSVEIY